MQSSRLLLVLALGIALTVVLPGLAGSETFLSMTASTDPVQPTTDEEFAVDVDFERPSSDTGVARVSEVTVYQVDRFEETELESVSPGEYVRSGGSTTVTVDEVEIEETGVHRLRVEATIVDSDDRERTVSTPLSVGVYGSDPLVGVDAADAVAGAWRPVNVTVANGLDEPLRGVSVAIDAEDVEFRQSERVTGNVAGGSDYVASFQARTEAEGVQPLDVTVQYQDPDGEQRTLSRTLQSDFTPPQDAGRIELTGVSATQSGSTVEISGSAANVGSAPVHSVVVAVEGTDAVAPAQPQPEYFVGSVDGSEFASFTVDADVEENASEIPVTVSYTVDGIQQTDTRTVSYSPSQSDGTSPESDGSGLGLLPIVGALLVATVGAGWYLRR